MLQQLRESDGVSRLDEHPANRGDCGTDSRHFSNTIKCLKVGVFEYQVISIRCPVTTCHAPNLQKGRDCHALCHARCHADVTQHRS